MIAPLLRCVKGKWVEFWGIRDGLAGVGRPYGGGDTPSRPAGWIPDYSGMTAKGG